MKIYLITHAHTEQVQGVAVDAWQLSPRGRDEALHLAQAALWDDVAQIVVSAEPKSWLTVAELARERALPVWVDSRLDELRRGGWIEDYARQVQAIFAEPRRAVGEWEAVDSVRQRAVAALDDLARRFAGETIAVVGHGLCLSIVRGYILGDEQINFHAWRRLAFGSYATVTWAPAQVLEDFPVAAIGTR